MFGIEIYEIKIADLTTNYFKTTTDLLYSITNELLEFKKIGPSFSYVENEIKKDFEEIGNLIHTANIEFSEHSNPFEK